MPQSWPTILALLIIVVTACSGWDSGANLAVRSDFQRYIRQLSAVGDVEVEGNEANRKATTEPGANDATYGAALRGTIVPKFEEFERELRRIHPMTDEILGLHKILLRRVKAQIAGFKELEQSTRGGGKTAIQKANDYFAEANVYGRRWSDQMDDLKKRYP